MLIQCKRYKDVVGIETVKAFWSDVHFEGAEKGLIATTSSVSRNSKKLCEVRKWPMSFPNLSQFSLISFRQLPCVKTDSEKITNHLHDR